MLLAKYLIAPILYTDVPKLSRVIQIVCLPGKFDCGSYSAVIWTVWYPSEFAKSRCQLLLYQILSKTPLEICIKWCLITQWEIPPGRKNRKCYVKCSTCHSSHTWGSRTATYLSSFTCLCAAAEVLWEMVTVVAVVAVILMSSKNLLSQPSHCEYCSGNAIHPNSGPVMQPHYQTKHCTCKEKEFTIKHTFFFYQELD